MTSNATHCLVRMFEERHALEDYQGGVPRWCNGCGDNAILAAVQRLCRDEDLRPEKTVFVSGIGCSCSCCSGSRGSSARRRCCSSRRRRCSRTPAGRGAPS